MKPEREIQLKKVISWANSNDEIRAMLLTSSLVNPDAPVDQFSDLDIEFAVQNLHRFLGNDEWLSNFGGVVAKIVEGEECFDEKHVMRMVFYADYSKIDFKVYSVEKFTEEVNNTEMQEDWDVGYKILVDKDGLTKNMKAATYQSVLIKKPTKEQFTQLLNDFWWDMTYVAKCLARDEIFYAKFMSEDNMRTNYLTKIIEWYIGLQHNWSITTNKRGRLFKKYLHPQMWEKVEATFSGSNIEDNWKSLFAYADLGHELGTTIADKLDYPYPYKLEKDIREYLRHVKTIS